MIGTRRVGQRYWHRRNSEPMHISPVVRGILLACFIVPSLIAFVRKGGNASPMVHCPTARRLIRISAPRFVLDRLAHLAS